MGRIILLQPNGQFAEWSTISDDFLLVDTTPEEIIKARVAEFEEKEAQEINKICDALKGGTSNRRFTWDDAIDRIRAVHGENSDNILFLRKHNLIK